MTKEYLEELEKTYQKCSLGVSEPNVIMDATGVYVRKPDGTVEKTLWENIDDEDLP
jgi:hypothetical protein